MKAPIPWLKQFVDTKLSTKELMWRLTEAGLTTEAYEKIDGEIILDIEVTPNRPDWLSIIGVSREVAAIEGKKLKQPKLPKIPQPTKNLPLKTKNDFRLCPRYTGVIIAGVTIKPSPGWMQKRLKQVGLRPINNLVDITNYVMFELGIPVHSFDYDQFKSKKLTLTTAQGGEKFTSVDGLAYKLSKGAIIIKDNGRVIDLCGIKGGENSGISTKTRNIFIHVPIYTPHLIRQTSQKLGLASDASYIYERGADAGSTMDTLRRVVDLILKHAGGKVASPVIDLKSEDFKPRRLSLNLEKLEKVLGIKINYPEVKKILTNLNLNPTKKSKTVSCVIPTYRNDLKIEEDLIEEVARLYGYNRFPKTLPVGETAIQKIPYNYDRSFELKLKNLISGAGYSEAMTLSLVSKKVIKNSQLNLDNHLKLANPVSREYGYMRTSLIPSLLLALKTNQEEEIVRLFEYSKVYLGIPGKTQEPYHLAAISKGTSFGEIKGAIDLILTRLNIAPLKLTPSIISKSLWHPSKSGVYEKGQKIVVTYGEISPQMLTNFGFEEKVYALEFDVASLKELSQEKVYQSVPKYPAQIEDITFKLPAKTMIGEVVDEILKEKLVTKTELTSTYKDTTTFRLWYQDPSQTLTDTEVEKIRKKVLERVKKKFGGISKS